ncbi:fumarylacetoacetate hydrolase family protein [Sphingomonas sp. KR1UV-12]|uniref:Fumarylacetoacetate hydrolase family protein n=1 Tax=Sphingomonas aurea TaxID=3063994 RepID=A0ABT9ENE2_9SPHN|nr:fumarylacetoacetate hydrolase family protein [Sphingomonas sp. KR1UV-12]MDP1028466.1 fumarylacetoacetate hydrolase family protein [Sphingomonas sp. KR1UV-12]
MKLLRYGEPGRERAGLLDENGRIRALPDALGDLAGDRLTPAGLAEIAALDPMALPVVEGDPRLGSCIARPGKFVCIGLNYRAHAAESDLPIPAEPVVFGKWSSATVGPNDDVEIPRGSEKTDWEVELGVVIGTRARHVAREEALSHVAGYCVVHDVSERAFQLERGGTWDKGKGCDTFGPTGPWLVTPDEVGDPQALRLWLEVDGHRYQDSTTADMIFSVAELVSYVSGFCTLEPGDIISTGTPEGVGLGQRPPVYLRAGQTVRLGIDRLGEQCQRFVAAA